MSGRDRVVVHVGGARAGVLAAEPTGRHVFAYDADCPPERFVALTMPVRLESYVWHELHPVFQVNLPDGGPLDPRRQKHGAARPIDALAALGDDALGRLHVSPGEAPAAASWPAALVTRRSAEFPDLAFNAWCALRAARRAGFEVPGFALDADGSTLRVERFDGPADARLGYEDFCALTGLGAAQKYAGEAERLVSAAAAFVAPVRRTSVRRELFRRIAFAHALRDGDAHLKRYGLLYSGTADVRLAPLYAALTTRVYPALADDEPALVLAGQRTWRPKVGTWRRFGAHCALSDRECATIFQWLQRALHAELDELEREAGAPHAASLAALRAQWTAGLDDLQAGY